jgi:deoxyribonuclease-4
VQVINSRPPIGAHIQIKGGLAKGGLAYADAVSAGAVQVFVGNPRGWKLTDGDPAQDALFTAGCLDRGVPSFIHTPFLVNVGSPTEATVEQSITSIAHNLRRGTQLGCEGVVVHAGSAVGEDRYEAALRQLHERLLPVLDGLPDDGPRLLIEPTAGGGKALAVGRGRLGVVHANDSLDECGSKRDRHTTIGEGSIGVTPFAELLAHPSMDGVPMVVETPSELDGSPSAGHARDIALLCSLRPVERQEAA